MKPTHNFRSTTTWPILACCALISLLISSCTAPDTTGSHRYYDVAGLVKGQIQTLETSKVSVYKSGILNGVALSATLDTINWHHELDPFILADINKPSWLGLYKLDSSKVERGTTLVYTAQRDDLPVRSLTVVLDQERHPLQLKASLQKLSMLNDGDQELELVFTEHEGKPALAAYMLSGTEKVTFQGPTQYKVRGDLKRIY